MSDMNPAMIPLHTNFPDGSGWARAVDILRAGGVLACPTETFYGLAADALSGKAVDRIFAIKGRDFRKPLPLVIGDRRQLGRLVRTIPPQADAFMTAFWPGPLTLVFWAAEILPEAVTAGTGKVGIRVSSHPVAAGLALALDGPLTATSANPSGEAECTNARHVTAQIGPLLDAVLDGGDTPGGLGSTVLDVTGTGPNVLREGAVSLERLRTVAPETFSRRNP